MRDPKHKIMIILIITCLLTGTMLLTSTDREAASVKTMLKKRSDIMENTLSGKITIDEGKKELKLIESDKLYSNDVKSLKKTIVDENFEKQKMNVLTIEKKQHVSDVQTYCGKIQWTYIEDGTVYYRNNEYLIGVKNNENELKLVSFELIE